MIGRALNCKIKNSQICSAGKGTANDWNQVDAPGHSGGLFVWLFVLGLVNLTPALAVDFERDIAAILETRCLACHDAGTASGEVRLDTHEQLLQVITPGKPEQSLLLQQVEGDQPAMPQDAPPLSKAEVQRLRDWIAAGADWPPQRLLRAAPQRDLDWWSLRPLPASDPGRDGPVDGKNLVDVLLEQRLLAAGIKPQPQATPEVLIRRLTYDLTGLPPTPEEVATFSLEHYEQTVDRLLASPAFGEKWARHWLDVARYGETHGYDKDQPRPNAWPYRDYVIAALNDDKPYPRFVQEQIAGDVLFPDDPAGVIALGFLAAGPWDLIGHVEVGEQKIDGRIAKHLDRDEMISAVFNVFTSTTVQCAQCHHHKFDPVTMEDYYRLHAVFAAVDRADREYAGPISQQLHQTKLWAAELAELERERAEIDAAIQAAVAARAPKHEQRIAELKQHSLSPPHPAHGWHSEISSRPDVTKWVQVDLGEPQVVQQIRLIAAFDQFANIGAGFGFPVRYQIETAADAEFTSAVRLLHDASGEDQINPQDEPVTIHLDGEPLRYIRITATRLAPRTDDYIFALGELEVIGSDPNRNLARGAWVSSSDSIEAEPRWGRSNLTDGIYHQELADPQALAELRRLERELAAIKAEVLTPEIAQRLREINERRATLEHQLQRLPRGPVVYAVASRFDSRGQFIATGGKPRPIHLLQRGDVGRPGEPMRPGMPPLWPDAIAEFSLSDDATEADARATLARAITSRANPLIWRSIVNRLWQWTFSQPLVGTPNDFGRMGMRPTHPELLDALAVRLRDDPQHSLKAIIRLLVTSQAYRRSSDHDEAAALVDADNHLLWRANRRRLTAEEFRDTLLWAGGKLRLEERGGPSFQDFVIEKPEHSPHYQYHLSDPNDSRTHRRSIYRFVVRSQPQPLLTVMDCADPSLSVAGRDESTTALQALTQWNNRLVAAMAQHFGERIATAESDPVDFACHVALGRPPDATEHAVLTAHMQAYGAASLARVLFNLNAFLYVD